MHNPTEIVIRGHAYNIRDLLRRREQNKENINLRTQTRRVAGRTRLKYTVEDRVWQAGASWQDIAARYGTSENSARVMQWQARDILARLDIDF